jgi:hypothetical protein
MKIRRAFLTLFVLMLWTGLATSGAKADIIYTYTGNAFTTNNTGDSSITNITFWFTTASLIPDNTSNYSYSLFDGGVPGNVLEYYMSDGVDTVMGSTTGLGGFIDTDSNGNITNWEAQAVAVTDGTSWYLYTYGSGGDLTSLSPSGPIGTYASNTTSGSWAEAVDAPEPSTFALLALGGAILAFAKRQRIRSFLTKPV